jgi:hypothetical protein
MRAAAACAVAVLLSISSSSTAQVWEELKKQTPEAIARGQTDFWTRTLGLSAEQSSALNEINLRYASTLSLAARAPGDQAQKLPAMRAAEARRSEEILELLTPAQGERYTAFEQRMERLLATSAR